MHLTSAVVHNFPKGFGCIKFLSPMHKTIPDFYSKREGGKYVPSGYMLLEYNLTGFVCCSHISGTLVRLHFFRSLTLMSMGRKVLLLDTLILKVVDRGYANSKCTGQMQNYVRIICLAYCLVIT